MKPRVEIWRTTNSGIFSILSALHCIRTPLKWGKYWLKGKFCRQLGKYLFEANFVVSRDCFPGELLWHHLGHLKYIWLKKRWFSNGEVRREHNLPFCPPLRLKLDTASLSMRLAPWLLQPRIWPSIKKNETLRQKYNFGETCASTMLNTLQSQRPAHSRQWWEGIQRLKSVTCADYCNMAGHWDDPWSSFTLACTCVTQWDYSCQRNVSRPKKIEKYQGADSREV